mmetsp:Transcript_776/g.4819  ORF Transcript_776/g.4819 Transcript_776/m.4819 type:complete len:501 (-) Transcript_776:233-1735(-)
MPTVLNRAGALLALAWIGADGGMGVYARRSSDLSPEQVSSMCERNTNVDDVLIEANANTVHWGFTYKGLPPLATVTSGDTISVEMATHHAGDDPEKMVYGDPGMESIYKWDAEGMSVPHRGAQGTGDGVHILTGPIHICGAEPGDVVQIDILELTPRPNPSTGKTYGVNAAAWWGYQNRNHMGLPNNLLDPNDQRDVITIYEVIEEDGKYYVQPVYFYRYDEALPTTNCTNPTSGTLEGTPFGWSNEDRTFFGVEIPCDDGEQTWPGLWYTGVVNGDNPSKAAYADYSGEAAFKLPANIHVGNIGLATSYDKPVDSVPPLPTGGNMDNQRINQGSTLYLPVQVEGALLSMGDAHMAQGDCELDGTAVETSINGKFRITLHKKSEGLPIIVQDLDFPLISTDTAYVIQSYAYADYLNELEDPTSSIYDKGNNLNRAMDNAYLKTRDWMMRVYNWSEDLAMSAITVGVDFGITQVVDGNWGMHTIIRKDAFPVPGSVDASSE